MLGIYTRLSRENENAKSIENQKISGIEVAKLLNLEYKIYQDDGVSGTLEIDKRPSFNNLLNDITDGIITDVFVTNQDRLERNPQVWFFVVDFFKKKNINLYYEGGAKFDYENTDAMFLGSISSLMNRMYVETSKKKSIAVINRNVKDGKAHGMLPYGFSRDDKKYLIIDEEESKVIEEIYKLSLSGMGTNSIANTLNEKGIPTRYKKLGEGTYKVLDKYRGTYKTLDKKDAQWKGNTIRTILKNPIYKGIRMWKNEEIPVPQILESDYWQKVNDNIPKNANNAGKKVAHKYLLKGLLRCNRCGRNMYGRTRESKKDHYYQCSSKRIKNQSCGNRSINIGKIEGVIWSRFFRDDELMKLIGRDLIKDDIKIDELENKIELQNKSIKQLSDRKDKIINAISNGVITNDDAKSQIESIKNELIEKNRLIKDFRIQLSNAKNSQSIIKNRKEEFESFTDKLSFLERQEIVKKYIREIYVQCWEGKTTIYSLIFKFKISLKDEHYVFDTRNEILLSLNEEKFYQSKYFNSSTLDVSISEDKELLKYFFVQPTGKVISVPFYIDNNNQAFFLFNTIIPHGNCSDWNEKKILSYYKKNPNWLSSESGLSKISIDPNKEDYQNKTNGYLDFKSKGRTNEEWIQFFLKSSGLSELFPS
ncbi:recombinase family protein [Thalassobellus citreus]|uniref:recombinase family protein n=1 Tax=Thalassobellus citreus TaxID=3367752 RepID=UPI0037AFB8BE